jgi:hypothetical protein
LQYGERVASVELFHARNSTRMKNASQLNSLTRVGCPTE